MATSARADLQRGWNVSPVAWRLGGQAEAETRSSDGWGGGMGGEALLETTASVDSPLHLCFCLPFVLNPGCPVTRPHPSSAPAMVSLYLPVPPGPLTHVLDITCLLPGEEELSLTEVVLSILSGLPW